MFTPWCIDLPWKLIFFRHLRFSQRRLWRFKTSPMLHHVPELLEVNSYSRFSNKFPGLYKTQTSTMVHLSWTTSIQSTSSYILFWICFNIILPYRPILPKWSLPFTFPAQIFIRTPHFYMNASFLYERLIPPMTKPTTTGQDPWLQFCNTVKLHEMMKRCLKLVQNFNLQESNKPSFRFSLNNNIHVA